MTIAAKQLDLTIGIDFHLLLVPMGPAMVPMIMPLPLPGLLFDPFAFLPLLGTGVESGGLPNAFAGSPSVPIIPHFPIGGIFMMPPGNTAQVFMGSSSVVIGGEPLSYTALPVLDCSSIGLPPIPRLRLMSPSMPTLFLPTSLVLTIPWGSTVDVGGPPTILADALGMAAAGGMLGLFGKAISKLRKHAKRATGNAAEGVLQWLAARGLCLMGHPVHVVTGANVDTFDDALVDGPLPMSWRRHYSSHHCAEDGPMGRGFRHDYQRALIRRVDGGLSYVQADGPEIPLPPLGDDRSEVSAYGFELRALGGERFEVRHADERMEFLLPAGAERGLMRRLAVGEDTLDFLYDDAGHLVTIWQATGERLCLLYDDAGHVVRTVLRGYRPDDEDATLGSYVYDTEGRLVEWRDAAGNAGHYAYDAQHRLTLCTDRRGYAFLFRYDAEGRCVESTGEDGLYHVALEYAPAEGRTTVTNADGGRWEYRYDERGTLTRIVDPYGGARVFRQDASGRVVEDVDPNGNVTRLLYDDSGRHYARVDPLGHVAPPLDEDPHPPDPLADDLPETPLEWEHGALFGVLEQGVGDERSGALAEAPADVRDLVIAHVDVRAGVHRDVEARDVNGNALRLRDGDGHQRAGRYASWNLLEREIDGNENATRYGYTSTATVARVEGPGGTVVEYDYDLKGRGSEVRINGEVFERYAYDLADNLISKTDAAGRTLLSLEIGPGNRARRCTLGSGETQIFERDARGRIVAARTDRLSCTFRHDEAGRQVEDRRDGAGVHHTFEGSELRETVYFDRFRVAYRRDGPHLTVTDPRGGRHVLSCDANGMVLRQLSSGATEAARYDAGGRCLLKVWSAAGSSGEPWVRTFHYMGEGDLLAARDSRRGTTIYAYDAGHRLRRRRRPSGEVDAYEYDAADNLIAQPGLSDVVMGAKNEICSALGQRFAYNRRERLASWESPSGARTYAYDAADRLTGATIDGEPWAAEYDPLCRRVSKTWRGRTTRYYWDGLRLAAEVHDDGSVRLYLYEAHRALVPFALVEYASIGAAPGKGRVYLLATDHLGTPTRVEDERGQAVWEATVDPFGSVHVERAEIELSLRFPGHWHDAETGLHYNLFRYYSPALGRYVEPDPLGSVAGTNLYAYMQGENPLRCVDLIGLTPSGTCRVRPKVIKIAKGRWVSNYDPWTEFTSEKAARTYHRLLAKKDPKRPAYNPREPTLYTYTHLKPHQLLGPNKQGPHIIAHRLLHRVLVRANTVEKMEEVFDDLVKSPADWKKALNLEGAAAMKNPQLAERLQRAIDDYAEYYKEAQALLPGATAADLPALKALANKLLSLDPYATYGWKTTTAASKAAIKGKGENVPDPSFDDLVDSPPAQSIVDKTAFAAHTTAWQTKFDDAFA